MTIPCRSAACFGIVVALVWLVAVPSGAESRRVTWSSVGDDAESLLEAPFEMDRDGVLRAAVAGAAIGASMLWLDERVDRLVRGDSGEWPWAAARRYSRLTTWYGESGTRALVVSSALVGAVAAGGYLADDDRMVDTAAIMGESVVFSTGLVYLTKMVFGRKRPYNDRGARSFEWFVSPRNEASLSFPSGHTATAFALAGAGAGRHPHWYVEFPAYALATAAALQRVDTRAHWTSDVIAGGLIGYAVAEFLVDRYENAGDARDGTKKVSVSLGVRF